MDKSTNGFTFSNFCLENGIRDSTKSDSSICSNQIQRSLSIEEPSPTSLFSIPSSRVLCNPKISDLRISLHSPELKTVSETKHNPVAEWGTNPQAFLSPDSASPVTFGHVHTYSDCTSSTAISSPCSSTDACYIPLSPINTEQSLRNLSYHRRHSSFDRVMFDIPDIVDQVITKCAAGDHSNTNHRQQNANNNDENNQQNNSNDNDNHNHSDNGSQNSNRNNHSGAGGDDEKKRQDDKHMDADDNDEDETEEKEEKEEEDDEALAGKDNKHKLNKNALPFQPITARNRSKSANAAKKLLTIDEHNILPGMVTAKSAPMAPVATDNTRIKPVLLNSLTPLCDEEEVKSIPATNSAYNGKKQYVYTPNTSHRAQGWLKIPKYLTTTLLPQRIAERISNLYDFMDKSTGIAMCNDNVLYHRNVIILNYGFHDKQTKQCLYLVADKQFENISKRNSKYVMRQHLYTKRELCNLYKLKASTLPSANHETLQDFSGKVNEIFNDSTTLCKKYIFHTKWHKLPVIHAMKNSKKYNKQRLTFSMTKTEFISIVERYVRNENNMKAVVPIVMFNCSGYRVEYVQIVQIRENIAIGISYVYNANKNSIKATGIHLNKQNILRQHQLYAPRHHCTCLDGFQSDIDDLHIGNPDDDKNRVKDLKKKNDALNETIKLKSKQIGGLVLDNEALKNRVRQLEQYIHNINAYAVHVPAVPSPISPMRPEYIQCVTPQSSTPMSILVTPSSFYNTPSVQTNNSISNASSTSQSGSSWSTFGQCANALNVMNSNYPNQ